MNMQLIQTLNAIVCKIANSEISDIQAEKEANKAIKEVALNEEIKLSDYDEYLDNLDSAASNLRLLARKFGTQSELNKAKSLASIARHFDEVISYKSVDAAL